MSLAAACYHIRNKYGDDVVAWAILTDRNKDFKPASYHTELLGTVLTYRFNTYKILEQDETALRNSLNPFAVAVLAVLVALRQKQKPDEVVTIWVEIARNLFKTELPPKKLSTILNFIKYIIRFTPEESYNFVEQLSKVTGKPTNKMSIEEQIISVAEKRGEKRGAETTLANLIKNCLQEGYSIATIAKLMDKPEMEVIRLMKEYKLQH